MKRALVVATAALLASTGCGSLFDTSLPGGNARGQAYHVTVVFDDVLDLVPQAAVKVNDVNVGDVEKIELDRSTFKARVRVRIKKSVDLPANTVAKVRQTSLLGEKFVELAPPTDAAPFGDLHDGDVIGSDSTTRVPEVEEVFSALSALLNGGGIGNLQTIAAELSAALAGREATVRDSLRNVTTMVQAFDARKQDIVRALDALDRLTGKLAAQRQTIGEALDAFTPALKILADQRAQLTALLTHLARLGQVGARVVKASTADTVASLKLLAPILDKVVQARGDLSKALDQVELLTRLVPRAIPGDYLQLYVEVYLDPSTTPFAPGAAVPAAPKQPTGAPTLPLPALPPPGSALSWLVTNGVAQ